MKRDGTKRNSALHGKQRKQILFPAFLEKLAKATLNGWECNCATKSFKTFVPKTVLVEAVHHWKTKHPEALKELKHGEWLGLYLKTRKPWGVT